MAIFTPYPKFDAGTSNAGAKLFTYEAGTSTKQATYTTPDESAANTNPVVLDSLGQANVLPGTGKSYKYVLAPSTDTDPPASPIWTVDNISTSSSAGGAPSVVNTLAELRALSSGAFTMVAMLGSSSAGDGAGATYYWSATSTTADDALYVIQPDSSPATGRWLMLADDLYIRSATPKLRLVDTDGTEYHQITVATDTLSVGIAGKNYISATATVATFGYDSGSTVLRGPAGVTVGASGQSVGFFDTTPQAQQAHIVDADGTLADITTKFNTLLADLEGYGLLASS